MQVPQAVIAQAQLGMLTPSPDGTITIQGSDGNPVKIPQAALASAPAVLPQMAGGIKIMFKLFSIRKQPRIVNYHQYQITLS